MRYQVFVIMFMVMVLSLSAMNSEYITRFGESNTSFRLNNMMIDDGRLYLCKEYGIDMFGIEENGDLSLLTTIIMDDINNFTVLRDNIYFACCSFGDNIWDTVVYKYDVSDPLQPVETGQLELDYPPYTMYIWHEMLTIVDFLTINQLIYYDPVTLEYLGSEEGPFVKPFYENYWCTNAANSLSVYDMSDPFNAVEVASVDLEFIGNNFNHECQRISDNLYVILSQHEMSLWDTFDFSNWQLLSQFPFPEFEHLFYDLNIVVWDNKILFPLIYEALIVDVSDPELPMVSQILYPALFNPTNCQKYDDKIYLVDNYVGIQILNIADNIIETGEVCTEFPKTGKGLIKDDYIIRETYYKSSAIPDMNIWDISQPCQPEMIEELSLGEDRNGYRLIGDILVLKSTDNLCVELYDVSALPEIQYLGNINYFDSEYEFMYGDIFISENEINTIYLKKPPGIITCFDISNPQNPQSLFEITEENYFIGGKQNDYLYLIESIFGSEGDIKIYSGIENNDPQLAAHYSNFMPVHCTSKILGDKLFVNDSYDDYTTQVYNLSGVEMPEFCCNLYSDCSGRVYSYGGEYLVCSSHDIYSFYIQENPPEYLEPTCHIGRFNFVNDVEVIHCESEDYLYIFDPAYTEVFLVESTFCDKNQVTQSIQIITYPNPFSYTYDQPITFLPVENSQRFSSQSKLSIYNIKGQLLHNEYIQQGRNEIIWDCRQNNGNKAPSGVYLYKVDIGDEPSVGKFIITK